MSINRWMDKEHVVDIYNGIILGHKKNEILLFVTTWMDLEGIMLSEISQTEKDKYHMISVICRISKKWINKTEIDPYIQITSWWLPKGRSRGGSSNDLAPRPSLIYLLLSTYYVLEIPPLWSICSRGDSQKLKQEQTNKHNNKRQQRLLREHTDDYNKAGAISDCMHALFYC